MTFAPSQIASVYWTSRLSGSPLYTPLMDHKTVNIHKYNVDYGRLYIYYIRQFINLTGFYVSLIP